MTRGRRGRILFQVILFVLIAVNVEMYAWRHLRLEGYETDDGIARRDAFTLWRLKPGTWPAGNSTLYVNPDGIRNRDVSGPPGPRVLRVMLLGGSVTYGSGLIDEVTFARRLEPLLQAMVSPGWTVEVINAGIPGHNSYQCLALYEELAPRYQPQIVIPTWGFNDGIPSTMRHYRELHGHGRWGVERVVAAVRGLMLRSATYRYLGHRLLAHPRPSNATGNDDDVADNLRYLDESAAENGARVLFVFEGSRSIDSLEQLYKEFGTIDPIYLESRRPEKIAALRSAYYAVVKERGIAALDMHAYLLEKGQDEVYLPNDVCHPSPFGAAIIAEALAQRLKGLGWLP